MHRINVMLDIDQEDLMKDKDIKPRRKIKTKKSIKIKDSLFEIALRKGLIEKTEDGYIFTGDYQDLLEFKNKRDKKSFY